MKIPDIPTFLLGTMSWTHAGYFLAAEPPLDLNGSAAREATQGPILFAHVLQLSKRGHFQSLSRLRPWLQQPLKEGWSKAAVILFGDAGGEAELQMIAGLLDAGPQETLIRASEAACMAGQLWLVPSMLRAWSRAESRDAYGMIGLNISRMLEPDWEGPILARRSNRSPNPELMRKFEALLGRDLHVASEDGPDDTTEFQGIVNGRLAEMRSEHDDRISLWRGKPFSVRDLVQEMRDLIGNLPVAPLRSLFIPMRHKLEATTGWNCSGCYRKGSLDPLGAMAVLEDLEENVELDAFTPGRRYFFGHPIPD